jgi:hypothetical protein
MTHEERFEKIEQQLARISDSQVVAEELRRQSDRRFENEREAVWAVIRANADQLSANAGQLSVLEAALLSLQAAIERFIQGQGGNGHGSTK